MSRARRLKPVTASGKPIGGGGAGNPRSLGNLVPGGAGGFKPGEGRPSEHGYYAHLAAERVDAKQAGLLHALAADAPLRDPTGGLPRHDTVAVHMLAKALCRLEDVEAYLVRRGLVDDDDRERPAVDLERRLRSEVADWLDALGMTPRSRARLGLDVARAASVDLAAIWAEQAAAEDRADADAIDGEDADV
jgi:hypothetical protein